MTATITEMLQPGARSEKRSKLCYFLVELRRRRVCRAITMYSVAIWLMCQIVDVISPALSLPDWTLRLVIVLGLLGLPVIIALSWLLEITPQGIVLDDMNKIARGRASVAASQRLVDRLIDSSLILAALAIGVQLAVAAVGAGAATAESIPYRVAVMPFRASIGGEAWHLSEGLAVELQHALGEYEEVTVIGSSEPEHMRGAQRLTGAVSTTDASVRITVTMIDFDSGEIAWSQAFEKPHTLTYRSAAELAQEIVAALPRPGQEPAGLRVANVDQGN